MIQIQKATTHDASGILWVHQTTWLNTYPNRYEGVTREDIEQKIATFTKERWEKRLVSDSSRHVLVAKNNSAVVGFAVGVKTEYNIIGALYVLSEFQHQGIGSELIKEQLKWLGEGKDCQTHVVTYNKPAIAFYEKHGFAYLRTEREDEWLRFTSGNIMKGVVMNRHAVA